MSDGMSDAARAAENERELHKATEAFKKALESAEAGHRGWGMSRSTIQDIVNAVLDGSGFKIGRGP